MKAFKKWLEENVHSNFTWEEDAEAAWKAALEWIYKEAKKLQEQPESPIDAFDLIEEELNETG